MRRNYFTEDEIVLCAYAALYDENEFDGSSGVHQLTKRSRVSISMKIRNIAAKLEEEGIPRNHRITPLTGTAPGNGNRPTNWDIVEPLTQKPQRDLQARCRKIVATS
jgi:hypothetical protein